MDGWISSVRTDPLAHVPDDLGLSLSPALSSWFRQQPQLRLRTVVPVVRDGFTIELYAWYDLHVFSDQGRVG